MFKQYLHSKIEYPISQLGFVAGLVTLSPDFVKTVVNNIVSLFFAMALFFITRYCKNKWPDKSDSIKKK